MMVTDSHRKKILAATKAVESNGTMARIAAPKIVGFFRSILNIAWQEAEQLPKTTRGS